MSSKNMGKPLTADLVFNKTKSDSLGNIKNLNLWGCELEDLSLIQKMPNLQVISLSVNRISTLKYFARCQKLQELYLRKNNIADIRDIKYLVNLTSLKVLWLHDNPCAQIQNYREIVVKYLPNLIKLDNNPVTQQQRVNSQNMAFNIDTNNNQSNYKSQKNPAPQYGQQKKVRPSSNYYQPPAPIQKQPEPQNLSYNMYQKQPPKKQTYENNKKIYEAPKQQDINRNQNILMAVLSLMRQLDSGSLQIVRRQAQKMLK